MRGVQMMRQHPVTAVVVCDACAGKRGEGEGPPPHVLRVILSHCADCGGGIGERLGVPYVVLLAAEGATAHG